MTNRPRRRRSGDPIAQDIDALAKARENAGMSKRWLAFQVGISEQLMGQIERGERNATPPTLAALAAVLDCEVADLERKQEAAK